MARDRAQELLERLQRHPVLTKDLPTRCALTAEELASLHPDDQRIVHDPGIQAIRAVPTFHEAVEVARALGEMQHEPAVPVLVDLWRRCPVIPVRAAAGHALFALDTREAHSALQSMRNDWDHLSGHLAAKSTIHVDPATAYDRVSDHIEAVLAGASQSERFVGDLLSILSYSAIRFQDGREVREYAHPDAPRWLRMDSRWVDLAVRLLDHPRLEDAARALLGELDDVELEDALGRGPKRPRVTPLTDPGGRDFVDWYRRGAESAWDELASLGPIEGALREQAEVVAADIMASVRRDAELLTTRLEERGFLFQYAPCPAPLPDVDERIAQLEELAGGRVPVSLAAFWRVVGGICWMPTEDPLPAPFSDANDEKLDPLVVLPIDDVFELSVHPWLERLEREHITVVGPLELELAPDRFHKMRISGGRSYSVRMPSGGADARLLYTPEDLDLVPYLRNAFAWGGLPGLALEKRLHPEIARVVERLGRGLGQF